MLELKDLFENFDLAEIALTLYDCNLEKSRKVFKYFRVSSNAIYPFFQNNDDFAFLRLSPVYSKQMQDVVAEQEFVKYLLANDYSVPEIVPMKDGNEVTVIDTQYGKYIVTAFYLVEGDSLDDYIEDNGISVDLAYKYGKALGQLHNLSVKYRPNNKRHSLQHFLDNVQQDLQQYGDSAIYNRFVADRKSLESIKHTPDNFGLIHYDFELDNVFIDDNKISVIDFDDSFYCFYDLDYVRAFNELNSYNQVIKDAFTDGYQSERKLTDTQHHKLFDRIGKYQHYGELCRLLSGNVTEQPDWLTEIIETSKHYVSLRKTELLSD